MDRKEILRSWEANTVMIGKRWWLLHLHAHTITIQMLIRLIGRTRSEIANREWSEREARWRESIRESLEKGIISAGVVPLDPGRSRKAGPEYYKQAPANTREMSIEDWMSGRG